jgi:hypothetical protein
MADQKQTNITSDQPGAERPQAPNTQVPDTQRDGGELKDAELDQVSGVVIIC